MLGIEPVDLLAPLGFVVGGLLLGLLFERIVLNRIRERLFGTGRRRGGVVVRSLRGLVPLWFGIGGLYLALVELSLEPEVAGLMRGTSCSPP